VHRQIATVESQPVRAIQTTLDLDLHSAAPNRLLDFLPKGPTERPVRILQLIVNPVAHRAIETTSDRWTSEGGNLTPSLFGSSIRRSYSKLVKVGAWVGSRFWARLFETLETIG